MYLVCATKRAITPSETQRSKQAPLAIYTPSELFDGSSGVCVDLARFAVETLKQIDPDSDPKYLMVESIRCRSKETHCDCTGW
jgi:hypothetical protein